MLHGCRQFVLWNVWLSPLNERNPHSCCYRRHNAPTSTHENSPWKRDGGGDDVKSSWPLWAGLHMCYNGENNKMQWCKSEQISKNRLSSDCSLQLENMKVESLVIADQHAAVNKLTGLVHTARQILGIGQTLNARIPYIISSAVSNLPCRWSREKMSHGLVNNWD